MFRTCLAAATLAACTGDTIVVGDLQEVASLKAIPNRDLDLLFVVDNSLSMADEQARLAQNFPLMIDVLSQLDGGLPNLHIGVVTSDMGTSGASGLPGAPTGVPGMGGCAETGDDGVLRGAPSLAGTFIVDVDDGAGGRLRNFTGELRDVFADLARVGEGGCGLEQHLAAMRRALTHPANVDFVRPEANLAVVIIADEDDCSVLDPARFFDAGDPSLGLMQSFRCTRAGVRCDQPLDEVGEKTGCTPDATSMLVEDVQPFVDSLLAIKADPRSILVSAIVGDPAPVAVERRELGGESQLALAPSCVFAGPGGAESADPAVRLAAFLDAFPERSTRTSICSDDLRAPLERIGESAKKLVGDPCIDTSRLADSSPEPGIQPACQVLDVRDSAPDAPSVLPSCATGAADCWQLVADPIACPGTSDHLRVTFRRSRVTDDTWTQVRCQPRP